MNKIFFISSITLVSFISIVSAMSYFLFFYKSNGENWKPIQISRELSSSMDKNPCQGKSFLIDKRNDKKYKIMGIANQCWMIENLNVGENLSDAKNAPSDNGTIEKWCYENNEDNCQTNGGLYSWNEVMGYSAQEGAQGICPIGWHIPTDEEWKQAEIVLGIPEEEVNYRGWRKMMSNKLDKLPNTNNDFNIIFSGFQNFENKSFASRGEYSRFWTSTTFLPVNAEQSYFAWHRDFIAGYSGTFRGTRYKEYGFSIRCVKDSS